MNKITIKHKLLTLLAIGVAGIIAASTAFGANLSNKDKQFLAAYDIEKLSAQAKQLAAGQSGYHVFHCPMLKKDWVQTSTTTANPYGGKDMVACGEKQK